MYENIHYLIATTNNSFDLFIKQLEEMAIDIRPIYSKCAYEILSNNEYIDTVITSVLSDQVAFDGYWERFDYEIDAKYIQENNQFLKEEVATNKWIKRKSKEISWILEFIEDNYSTERDLIPDIKPKAIQIGKTFQTDETIKILFNALNRKYIQTDLSDFRLHFNDSIDWEKITWLGKEVEIKFLFDWLTEKKIIISDKLNVLIAEHFNNKKNNAFVPKQLSTVKGPTYERLMNKTKNTKSSENETLVELIQEIKKELF